jgi:hypothetical protein
VRRGWAIPLAVAGVLGVGCGSSATAVRSIGTVSHCLRARHVAVAVARDRETFMPQPTAGQVNRLEACAFGSDAHPAIGRLVLAGGRVRSGPQIVQQSGCLACHRIGSQGNDGPGPNLTAVGRALTPQAIARVLRHPRAPMPPSRLGRRDFQALVGYLTHLH